MEEQQEDDIPMMDGMDASIPTAAATANSSNSSSSSAQRFSIVDVLGGGSGGGGGDLTTSAAGNGTIIGGSGSKEALAIAAGPLSAPPDPTHSDIYEYDEGNVMQRLQKLYPHTDIQKLPRFWSKLDRWTPHPGQNNNGAQPLPILELSTDFLRVTKRKGTNQNSKDAAAVRANRPIPRSCIVYYFEITVVSKGQDGFMGVGLSEKNVSLNRLPGWDPTSYGYHGDDGNFFSSSGKGVEYGPTFTTGDVVGCGLNFVTRELFFTKNGEHLGVANSLPIPLNNELYPTMGMQTADEMIDANFGQRPFVFDLRSELKMAESATLESIRSIELPAEKVLWMNNLVSNWLAHEGYSRALDALNRATGGGKVESPQQLTKSDSQGSTITSSSKDSQSPTVVAERVAEVVMRSMIGLLGGEEKQNVAGGGATRRSVVRSVQEALHEEMEQRRAVVRMVRRGQLSEATEKIEQLFPSLFETNRQLALLIKTQHFIEMLRDICKELPPLPQEHHHHQRHHHQQEASSSLSAWQHNSNFPSRGSHSPSSPRPSSSRGGKRSASAVEDDYYYGTSLAGTSHDEGGGGSNSNQHNPVKRRSSDDECQAETDNNPHPHHNHPNSSSRQPKLQHQNGNSPAVRVPQQQQQSQHSQINEFMEIGEDGRQDGNSSSSMVATTFEAMSNGNACSNGISVLVGTPPTSTTIIKEYDSGEFISIGDESAPELELTLDGFPMEMGGGNEDKEEAEYGGFANTEEQHQFDRYAALLEFGQEISRFSMRMDGIDDGHEATNCAALRHRMNAAFSLLCYRDPNQSDYAYLMDQSQRDMVARALNSAIIESHGKEGTSPLDKCLRRARFIRDQALVHSASAIFLDAPHLLFGENTGGTSPGHGGSEERSEKSQEHGGGASFGSKERQGGGGGGKSGPTSKMSGSSRQQKKEL